MSGYPGGIVDFLLARLAEDDSALPADDSGKRSTSRAWWSNDFEVVFIEEDRWRAEIEAKRRIVRAVSDWLDTHPAEDHVPAGDDALCWLALPYADHPDYRQAWRP